MLQLNKVRKVYPDDFLKKIEYNTSSQFVEDFKKTYYWEKLRTAIFEEDFYVREYPKNKTKFRITFPLFLISVLLLFLFGAIKWLFVGSATLNEKWWIVNKMIAWDKYCRFNII